MAATTLAKIFPRIDKICDAAFIKKALGTTKKDSVLFITENDECQAFLTEKEETIDRHNKLVREDIMEFLRGERMQLAIAKFRASIKEKVAMDKASKKVLEKQAIIEEFLREQEKLKKDNEERAKLGLPPKSDPNAPAKAKVTDDDDGDADEEVDEPPAPTPAKKGKTETTRSDSGTESSEETQMNLDDFLNLFKAVYDQGHIVFKQGETVMKNVEIKLDQELQKIVVQAKVVPIISLKPRLVPS